MINPRSFAHFFNPFFFSQDNEGEEDEANLFFCLSSADLCGCGPTVVDLQEMFEISSNLCIFGMSKIWTLGVQKTGFFVGFLGFKSGRSFVVFFWFERNLNFCSWCFC